MQTVQHHHYHASYATNMHSGAFSRFINWCKGEEKNHFGWVGLMLVIHGCILVPISLFCIFAAGNNPVFWVIILSSMAVSLIGNLAALPTKITIPVFFASVLVDIIVIGICLAQILK